MYADALTKRDGNVPLLQTIMRTTRICITEVSATLEKHKLDPKSRSSHSKTRSDPAVKEDSECTDLSALLSVHVETWSGYRFDASLALTMSTRVC